MLLIAFPFFLRVNSFTLNRGKLQVLCLIGPGFLFYPRQDYSAVLTELTVKG